MIETGDTVKVMVACITRPVGTEVLVKEVSKDGGCLVLDGEGLRGSYRLDQLELVSKGKIALTKGADPVWILISETLGQHEGENTSAMVAGSGCIIRTHAWDSDVGASESNVFVPDSYIEGGKVVAKPTRFQVSKSQNLLIDEVAGLCKRKDILVFTLRSGKEVTISEDIDAVLEDFLQVAP